MTTALTFFFLPNRIPHPVHPSRLWHSSQTFAEQLSQPYPHFSTSQSTHRFPPQPAHSQLKDLGGIGVSRSSLASGSSLTSLAQLEHMVETPHEIHRWMPSHLSQKGVSQRGQTQTNQHVIHSSQTHLCPRLHARPPLGEQALQTTPPADQQGQLPHRSQGDFESAEHARHGSNFGGCCGLVALAASVACEAEVPLEGSGTTGRGRPTHCLRSVWQDHE
jgi:hypothetical protein